MAIFTHSFFTRVRLPAKWMHCTSSTIDREIMRRTQARYGDRCCEEGYVYGDTILVTKRGPGVLDSVVNDGGMLFDVQFVASVCMPGAGEHIRCEVKHINTEGVKCSADESNLCETPLDIVLPIRWHRDEMLRDRLRSIQPGAKITVRVMGCRFTTGDPGMSVVVEYVGPSSPPPSQHNN